MTVEQLVAQIRALPPEEREKVIAVLDEEPEDKASLRERERAFEERLKAEGRIYRLPLNDEDVWVDSVEFQPVPVVGKPVSETIIEERR